MSPVFGGYSSSFDWFQCGDKEWISYAHGFSSLVAYDEEFDAYEWTIRVEQTQKIWRSGMSHLPEEARHAVERDIRLHISTRRDTAA